MDDTVSPLITKAQLRPLTDVLLVRHGWNYLDFKIKLNMAVRLSGRLKLSKFPGPGMMRAYLRSMKRLRRWLWLDHITYIDEIIKPNDVILFEKAGFQYIERRGFFEIWDTPTGLESLDQHLGSKTTSDESIFDRVLKITKLGDYNFTVAVDDKL